MLASESEEDPDERCPERRVEEHERNERHANPGLLGHRVCGGEVAVNDPRLSSVLRDHPASLNCKEASWAGENEKPKDETACRNVKRLPATAFTPDAKPEECACEDQQDTTRDHRIKGEVHDFRLPWLAICWNLVKSSDNGIGIKVDQEAHPTRNLNAEWKSHRLIWSSDLYPLGGGKFSRLLVIKFDS